MPDIDLQLGQLAPAITLLVTVFGTLLFALWLKDSRQTALIALLGLITAFGFNLSSFLSEPGAVSSFGMRFLADTPALALNFLVLIGAMLAVALVWLAGPLLAFGGDAESPPARPFDRREAGGRTAGRRQQPHLRCFGR